MHLHPRRSVRLSSIKVLIKPFLGVAPRLYERAFMKIRPLKNDSGTLSFGEPLWASGLLKLSYRDVETRLVENQEDPQ